MEWNKFTVNFSMNGNWLIFWRLVIGVIKKKNWSLANDTTADCWYAISIVWRPKNKLKLWQSRNTADYPVDEQRA